jgi:Protein of unknown function (DUF3460)
MALFWKHYQSETTEFINSLKAQNPDLENQQRLGRALLWDHPLDFFAQAQYLQDKVAQQAYVYQTKR